MTLPAAGVLVVGRNHSAPEAVDPSVLILQFWFCCCYSSWRWSSV